MCRSESVWKREQVQGYNKLNLTNNLRDSEDDLMWRIRWGNERCYGFLLREFQSTGDHLWLYESTAS